MQFSSLGSGSKGNGTVVRYRDCTLLIDCGFTLKETEKRLRSLGVSPEDIDGVLVTHEHGDHINGVGPLARRYGCRVYMTAGTYRSRDIGAIPNLTLIKEYTPFSIKDIDIHPVAVPHDAEEPAQYIVEAGGKRLGLLTDLGSSTPHIESRYQACDALILEANHDPLMLASGPYPPSLKDRVASAWGHLSNQQAAMLLERVICSRLKHLVVAHISEKNNTIELAREHFDKLALNQQHVIYASQNEGFAWIDLQPIR